MELRAYQSEAITAWKNSDYSCIWEMATGTGKTFTAVMALVELTHHLKSIRTSSLTLVVCPLLDLADQWQSSLEDQGFQVLRAAEGQSGWNRQFMSIVEELSFVPGRQRVVVTTTSTFTSAAFRKILSAITSEIVFVADEVHNFGSINLLEALPKKAKYRLGLSATPRRWNDLFGTQAIIDYFGDVAFQMSIKAAIQVGVLTPYYYYPRMNPMSPLETELYSELTTQLAAVLKGRSFNELDKVSAQKAGAILTTRAALLGSVESKWPTFSGDLSVNENLFGQLIYCGVGSSPLTPGLREIELTETKMSSAGYKSLAKYESLTDRPSRKALLKDFRENRLKYLLSMRCLDEGVDIPSAGTAYFIASSSNPRQFIQRRGRVLRQFPGKSSATIYDYFLLPSGLSGPGNSLSTDKAIGRRELDRTLDFIDSCLNPKEALEAISPLVEMYGNG